MAAKPYVVVEWNDTQSDAVGWLCTYNFVGHYCGGTRMHPTVTKEEVGGEFIQAESELAGVINFGRCEIAHSGAQAAELFSGMGLKKAVLKIESPDILHKTDAGCVKLNIIDSVSAADAYESIIKNAAAYSPCARIDGVQVCEQLETGTELIIGVKSDPQFGPCIMLGLGGVFVEVFRDTAFALAPVTLYEAQHMTDSLRSKKLLCGWRGSVPCDTAALAKAIVSISEYAVSHSHELVELDLNPVFLYEQGRGLSAADTLYINGEE